MAIQLLINCKLRRSQSSLHTSRRCIPNVPTYISIDHEHQNGIINSSLVGVIIGDWKFYNHQGLCFNSKRRIRVGLMNITCGLMISQDRNLIRLFGAMPRIRTPPSTVTFKYLVEVIKDINFKEYYPQKNCKKLLPELNIKKDDILNLLEINSQNNNNNIINNNILKKKNFKKLYPNDDKGYPELNINDSINQLDISLEYYSKSSLINDFIKIFNDVVNNKNFSLYNIKEKIFKLNESFILKVRTKLVDLIKLKNNLTKILFLLFQRN
ncbi:hypothetical protein H8356DRAFT_1381527 [Neocallimastix lanati (nom. inval.)]|nr:hypothetical protein H8356DRAFT_1381527 [Neocallimastix sp. JGI-2020a]